MFLVNENCRKVTTNEMVEMFFFNSEVEQNINTNNTNNTNNTKPISENENKFRKSRKRNDTMSVSI